MEIKELVLHGFDYHDYRRIGVAIEQELSRLIRENGLLQYIVAGSEIPRIDAGSFSLATDMNPKTIGAEVARSIYRGLRQRVNL